MTLGAGDLSRGRVLLPAGVEDLADEGEVVAALAGEAVYLVLEEPS